MTGTPCVSWEKNNNRKDILLWKEKNEPHFLYHQESWSGIGSYSSLPFTIKPKTYLTKYSSVSGISNIDLTPAQTTVTGVFPSSIKSALMSKAEMKLVKDVTW